MGLKKYFEILGLPETASQPEIRKQFRRLAMRYHPDKNQSLNAEKKFIQITDAYEILTGKKAAPKSSLVHISKTKEKSQTERIKDAKKRYYEQIIKEQIENERYFKSLFKGKKWKILKSASIIGPILSVFLILDLFLPHHYEKDRVEFYAKNLDTGELLGKNKLIRTEKGNDYWVSGLDFKLYGEYPTIYVESSWFFHQPVQVISIQKIRYSFYPVRYTFISLFWLVVLFFCLPLFVRFYRRKKVWYTVIYHLALYFSVGLIIVFLLTNDHWAHLLTLGFL